MSGRSLRKISISRSQPIIRFQLGMLWDANEALTSEEPEIINGQDDFFQETC